MVFSFGLIFFIMSPTLTHIVSVEPTQFCKALVKHIHIVLQEHDQLREDEKDWVSNEAMNQMSLRYGGTFRNVLSRKIDNVIVPIFSQIIASIDHNYNLSLIDPENENSHQSQFWLKMFSNFRIMQFNYIDMVTENVPELRRRKTSEDFQSKFPFSWLVFKAFENQWGNVKGTAGK